MSTVMYCYKVKKKDLWNVINSVRLVYRQFNPYFKAAMEIKREGNE